MDKRKNYLILATEIYKVEYNCKANNIKEVREKWFFCDKRQVIETRRGLAISKITKIKERDMKRRNGR